MHNLPLFLYLTFLYFNCMANVSSKPIEKIPNITKLYYEHRRNGDECIYEFSNDTVERYKTNRKRRSVTTPLEEIVKESLNVDKTRKFCIPAADGGTNFVGARKTFVKIPISLKIQGIKLKIAQKNVAGGAKLAKKLVHIPIATQKLVAKGITKKIIVAKSLLKKGLAIKGINPFQHLFQSDSILGASPQTLSRLIQPQIV